MKKIVVVLMSMLAMLVAACGGSNAEAISTDNGGKIMQSENKTNSSKALVVYYSRSGNTDLFLFRYYEGKVYLHSWNIDIRSLCFL